MNKWARNRKRVVYGIVFIFLVVVIGLPTYFLFYKAPTCFDYKMNGDEAGVDCGGSCQLLCTTESLPLLVEGDPRVLTLGPGVYQVVAVVENANNDGEIYRAGYTIKLYDNSTLIPVRVIEGSTFVPAGETFAIFEGPLFMEDGVIPSRATLEWKEETLIWKKAVSTDPGLTVKESTFTRLATSPRLESKIVNPTLSMASNIDLVALVSDKNGNIFAASKTFIDSLMPSEESAIVFTWPRSFQEEPAGIEIIIRVFPDRSFIR